MTTNTGGTLTGVLTVSSNIRVSGEIDLGTSNGNKFMDVCLGDNYGFYLRSTSGEGANHEMLMLIERNKGATLYWDANPRFTTIERGIQVSNSGGNSEIRCLGTGGNRADVMILQTGTANANLWLDASNGDLSGADYANIKQTDSTLDLEFINYGADIIMYVRGGSLGAGGLRKAFHAHENGAVELYHNGNKKFHTFDSGVVITGDAQWMDGDDAQFGSSADLKIYHNGTDSYISNGTNNLRIGNTHSNNIKFFTNNSTRWNIDGNGHIIPDVNNTYDIGSTAYRVRNLYTNDLNLSNEGDTNDVDGTWGSYTIQEGEDDLFLINKRNGKKYKFNLTEVS